MPELWLNLLTTLLLSALFSSVASSYSNGKHFSMDENASIYISKSIDTTDCLVKYVKERRIIDNNNKQYYNDASVSKTQEQPIKTDHVVKQTQSSKLNETEISQTIRELFRFDDRPGLVRLDTTSEEMLGDEPGSTTFVNSELPHSIKVQRSPDGKLNFVVNDLISLQTETTQDHTYRTPMSDKPQRRKSKPMLPLIVTTPTTAEQIRCEDNDASNKTFCTKVSNYPNIASLRSLLSSKFASFFGDELPEPDEIGTRMDDGRDSAQDEYLCSSRTRTIYPQWGQTSDSGGQIIINNEEFKQGVRIEECTNPGGSCKYMESIMNHYVSECKQHYTYRVLASLTANGDASSVTKQNFKFASCCKCAVRSTLN